MEISKPSTYMISLNIMQMNIITNTCCQQGKEFANIFRIWMYKRI